MLMTEVTASTLKELHAQTQAVATTIRTDNEWGFNLSWEMFILGMMFLPPQAYGQRIQNRLLKELHLERAHHDNGDFKDRFGDFYEVKSSILQHADAKMNLVQIRPWQKAHFCCFVFDVRTGVVTPHAFKLNAPQMSEEMRMLNATSAHGTVAANAHNRNIEYRLSMNVSMLDVHFRRWKDNYASNFFSK